jgi:hypothetical protein
MQDGIWLPGGFCRHWPPFLPRPRIKGLHASGQHLQRIIFTTDAAPAVAGNPLNYNKYPGKRQKAQFGVVYQFEDLGRKFSN